VDPITTRIATLFRVARRHFALQNKPSRQIHDMAKASMHRFEHLIRQVTGIEYKGGYLADHGGFVSVTFIGPKKKGEGKSTVDQEPYGRFVIEWKVTPKEEVDVTVKYLPWKDTHIDMNGAHKTEKSGTELAVADETALQLLSHAAEAAKHMTSKMSRVKPSEWKTA